MIRSELLYAAMQEIVEMWGAWDTVLASRMAPQILEWPALKGCLELADMANPTGRQAHWALSWRAILELGATLEASTVCMYILLHPKVTVST